VPEPQLHLELRTLPYELLSDHLGLETNLRAHPHGCAVGSHCAAHAVLALNVAVKGRQYEPPRSESSAEPTSSTVGTHVKCEGHGQYVAPSSVLPRAFAHRHDQTTTASARRSRHCGSTGAADESSAGPVTSSPSGVAHCGLPPFPPTCP
jgi:hypothetical protein